MSTLSMDIRRSASTVDSRTDSGTEIDARFGALVRAAVPAQRLGKDVGFETVFDLDYGRTDSVAPVLLVPAVSGAEAKRRVRIATMPQRTPPRHVRLTRRGRMVLVLVFISVALGVMTALSGWATASLSGGTPERVRVVEVQPGDTLYDIAADIAQPGQIRAMVHRIQELNSLPGGSIVEGQKLAVPRG